MEEPVIVLSSGENGDDDHDNEVQVVEVKGGGSVVEVIDLTCSPYDDEYAVLSDMRGFENLAAMLEAEKFRRKKKRKRKKRRKWHECIAPQPAGNFENVEEQMNRKAVETNKVWETEINPISVKAMPQNLGGNVENKEAKVNLKATDKSKASETETNHTLKEMRQNLGANVESEGEQVNLKAMETNNILETETNPISVNDMQQNIGGNVEYKEEQVNLKAVETNKVWETETNPISVKDMRQNLGVDTVEAKKLADTNKSIGIVITEMQGNAVLRKLLRGSRYFDIPESRWKMCHNCGEDSHAAVNCMQQQRTKPCFICRSFECSGKQCEQHCFFCQRRGHFAKDCPDKHEEDCVTSQICLRCGDSGHDLMSCGNNYSSHDLRKIQCYMCKSFGHLCCANFPELDPCQVTCYNCGLPGHVGSACKKLCGDASRTRSPLCYNCGEEGLKQDCAPDAEVGWSMGDLLTPNQGNAENKIVTQYLLYSEKRHT
ncbi:uncharacterized protein LOC131164052 isoform X2 [Malania oleifera]|uniref:uncharacterized protein LOC131164052 isoform X2 n=1 Tax=Malania oleifera TaxID=397392 RepID=UPI0025AE45AC|nr:uncharacterized protein LOC131164052 isoform X2 [Malania oleifera]